MFRPLMKSLLAATLSLGLCLPGFAQPADPAPDYISTEAAASSGVQERLQALLARADLAARLAERGVSVEQLRERVAALTDAEATALLAQIDSAPAGAADIVGTLFTVFIILLVTDILGLTKVFPFTRPVR